MRVGQTALLLVPRTGSCAVLEWLMEYAHPQIRAELQGRVPGDIRQRRALFHAPSSSATHRLAVSRDPLERLWSTLLLHVTSAPQRSARAWQFAHGLIAYDGAAITEPQELARALHHQLEEADEAHPPPLPTDRAAVYARLLREDIMWRPLAAFDANGYVPYDPSGAALRERLICLGWAPRDAPPMRPGTHASAGPSWANASRDAAIRAAVSALATRLGWLGGSSGEA